MRKFSKKICAFVSLFVKSETNRGKKGAVFGSFLVSHEIVRQPLFCRENGVGVGLLGKISKSRPFLLEKSGKLW